MNDILNEPISIDNPTENKQEEKAVRIAIIADESGSMFGAAKATVDAINKYLDEQKDKVEPILVSVYTFNSATGVKNRFRSVDAKSAPRLFRNNDLFENKDIDPILVYAPAGNTPLYDAIAEVISTETTGTPTLLVILTDGLENASKEYNLDRIKELIKKQEDEEWSFVFLMAGLSRQLAEDYSASLMGRNYVGATMSYEKGTEHAAFDALDSATQTWEASNRAAMKVGAKLDATKLTKNFFAEGTRDIKNKKK